MLLLTFDGLSLIFNHPGFAQGIFNITFWILLFGVWQYIREIRKEKGNVSSTQTTSPLSNKFSFLILVLLLMGIFWQWWLPGPKVANDFPLVSNSSARSLMSWPWVWTEKGSVGLGEYTIFTLWFFPLTFIWGTLANLGLSFAVLERILLILILFTGTFGIWQVGQYFNLSNLAKIISSVIFLTNTYILLLIDGGQLSIALAYVWFPICYLLVDKSIGSNFRNQLTAIFATAVLGFFDIRFIYLLVILSLIRFVYGLLYLGYKNWPIWTLSWIKLGTISALVILGLHTFWLYPLSKAPISSRVFAQLIQNPFVSFISLGHSFLLLAPHWYKNVFGNVTALRFEFIIIPILVFLAPILKPKNRMIGFWLLVSLVAVFLTKGTSEPLPKFYSFLSSNIPGFSLFRDSSKFFVLLGLSYSLLLAVTLEEILRKVNRFPRLGLVFLILLTSYLLWLIQPAWSGKMTGTFSNSPLQKEYLKLSNLLENDHKFSRTFWIPYTAPYAYSSTEHPILEAARLVQTRPFNIGTKGAYELFNFLREGPYMGEIFDVASIGYLVYPSLDPRRDNLHPDNIKYYHTFSDQLSKLPWLSRVDNSPIPLWQTKKHQDRFFITPNIWWVIGSDNIYNEATKSSQLRLSQNALIFAEEYPGFGNRIDQLPEAKIVLNNKTTLDLAASFIESTQLIFPARQLDFVPNASGWWKREAADLIRWRDFLQTKYNIDNQDFDLGGGWAVGEGEKKFQISNFKYQKDSVLLARVLESTRSGQLRFYQNDELIGKIDTKKEGNNVRWFGVGQLKKDRELTVASVGDINVVNSLAILDKDEWLKLKNKAQSLQSRVSDFDEKNTRGERALVNYHQINPTKYKVSIKNLSGPSFLVFSQSYDRLWKMDGQGSSPVYSLLNGFRVEGDGEYEVYFEPQKYVYPGLIISGLTLFVILGLILLPKHKNPKFRI